MNEFAGSLRRKFISLLHLGLESSAHIMTEERKSANPQNFDEFNTVAVGETTTSPPKVSVRFAKSADFE